MWSEMKIVLIAVAVDVGWVGCRFNDIFHCFTWIPDWWLWLFVEYFHIYLAIMNYSFLCYWKVILKAFVIQLCHTDPRDTFRGLNGQSAVRWPAPSPRHPPPQTWSWTRMDTTWGHIILHCTVKHHTDIINFACMTWNFVCISASLSELCTNINQIRHWHCISCKILPHFDVRTISVAQKR